MPSPRPRVFVSSVVDGFREFRQAARHGIESAGGEAVLLNEDFPSLASSSRNACLDAVNSCDYLLSIVGERGGFVAPSGLLVVEEEFDHARSRNIPRLAFLQKVDRDPEANRFARKLSDYVDGNFLRTFSNPAELEAEIAHSLLPLLNSRGSTRMTRSNSADYFRNPYRVQNTTMLRLVLFPERDEEVIDPVQLGSESFRSRVYSIGHSPSVRLMSFERPKTPTVKNDSLIITQTESDSRHGEGEQVRLQISEKGEIVIDANVTGRVRRGSDHGMMDSMVIAFEDIESVLGICFKFSDVFFDEIDPYKRHQRFYYNVGLSGLGYRAFARNPKERTSYPVNMRSGEETLVVFDEPRILTRDGVKNPSSEITRVVTIVERKGAA